MYFLGVDGGGTKTQFIISDEKGNILGKSLGGSTYIRSIEIEEICETLKVGITEALKNANLRDTVFTKSCFGIAGLDNPKDFDNFLKYVNSISEGVLGENPIVLNDAVCALRRGTNKGFGVTIVAGTGSNCYGKNKEGKEVYVGGLGHIISDEGGGYYVGLAVLHSAAKSYDGRIEKSMLEELVYKHFGLSNMRDVILKVHEKTFGKKDIASLARVCEEASDKGDKEAQSIFLRAATELFLMGSTAIKKLGMQNEEFDLVCSGGAFKNEEGVLRKKLEELIQVNFPKATVIYPDNEPAMGAVFMAIDSSTLSQKL